MEDRTAGGGGSHLGKHVTPSPGTAGSCAPLPSPPLPLLTPACTSLSTACCLLLSCSLHPHRCSILIAAQPTAGTPLPAEQLALPCTVHCELHTTLHCTLCTVH